MANLRLTEGFLDYIISNRDFPEELCRVQIIRLVQEWSETLQKPIILFEISDGRARFRGCGMLPSNENLFKYHNQQLERRPVIQFRKILDYDVVVEQRRKVVIILKSFQVLGGGGTLIGDPQPFRRLNEGETDIVNKMCNSVMESMVKHQRDHPDLYVAFLPPTPERTPRAAAQRPPQHQIQATRDLRQEFANVAINNPGTSAQDGQQPMDVDIADTHKVDRLTNTQDRWDVTVRVMSKTDIIQFRRENGRNGCRFVMKLIDNTGAIMATAFGAACDRHGQFTVGNIYLLRGRGRLENDRKQYSSTIHPLKIGLEQLIDIVPQPDNQIIPRYLFVNLRNPRDIIGVPYMQNNPLIEIIGKLDYCGALRIVNNENFIDVFLYDLTTDDKICVEFWGRKANETNERRVEIERSTRIAIDQVKKTNRQSNGIEQYSVQPSSVLVTNPNI